MVALWGALGGHPVGSIPDASAPSRGSRAANSRLIPIRHASVCKVRPARGDLAGHPGHTSASLPAAGAAGSSGAAACWWEGRRPRRLRGCSSRHPAGVEGWRPGALDRGRAEAAAASRVVERRGGRGLPWRRLVSEQPLVGKAKVRGGAIPENEVIQEGDAEQLPRVHQAPRQGPILLTGRRVA
jgi:hypothetical protein